MNSCKRCGEPTKGTYCSNSCQGLYQSDEKAKAFLRGEYKGKKLLYAAGRWNRRLLSEQLGELCGHCGITEWNGKPITLEVNHIDGQAYNNVLDNLELLCPNCHSQTDTFRNLGGRQSDRTYRKPV